MSMKNNNYRHAKVLIQGMYAGEIAETESGYCFQYAAEYLHSSNAVAVSLTMPLQETAYESPLFFPFFDGLIPEGWLLQAVSHNWKIDQNDRFGLLLIACHDCIGDVQILAE